MKRRSTPAPGEPIVIDAHGRHAQAVAFTKDGKRLVSAGQDACVRLWSVPGFKADCVFEGHSNSVNSLSFCPDGSLLATGSTDGTVRVWSFPQGKCLHALAKQLTARFAPDGALLATISVKGRVVLWDAKTGEEVKTLPALDKRITALTFTPDAATLLVGGTGPIHRVSLPEGKKVGELEGHKVVVACLRLTPDGKLLASTGGDGILRLWSTEDWSEVRKVALRAGGVLQMAIAPKGDVVTVGADHLIQTFSIKDGKLVRGNYSSAARLRPSNPHARPNNAGNGGRQPARAHHPLPLVAWSCCSALYPVQQACAGRTPGDVLTDVFKQVPIGPTAAQAHHDPAATHDHRRRHLDEQEPPGRRLPLPQRVLDATCILIGFPSRSDQRLGRHVSRGSRRGIGDLPTQSH